jgi:HNH endonuclease
MKRAYPGGRDGKAGAMKLKFCAACGITDGSALNHHHLRPRVHGGTDDERNLITLCHECHGKMHGCDWWEGNFWSNDHSELTKAGVAAARLVASNWAAIVAVLPG